MGKLDLCLSEAEYMRKLPGKNSHSDLSWKFCYNEFFNSPVY